jgi:hypothetical protein
MNFLSPQRTSKGAFEPNNRLCVPGFFGRLALFANNYICVPWEPTVRTMAQHDSALCLDWTPARSCQKPGFEGTYPSWSDAEMWDRQAAMTGKICVVCAIHGCQRVSANSNSMRSLHDCLRHATRCRHTVAETRLKDAGLHDIRPRTALLGAQCSAVEHETHT